jgi:hypothetical protein
MESAKEVATLAEKLHLEEQVVAKQTHDIDGANSGGTTRSGQYAVVPISTHS